jgi:hypothetical protein
VTPVVGGRNIRTIGSSTMSVLATVAYGNVLRQFFVRMAIRRQLPNPHLNEGVLLYYHFVGSTVAQKGDW